MSKQPILKVGGKIRVWWNTGEPNNMATVLKILPYRGHFTQFYDCVLVLPAPNTHRGTVEMAYNSSDYAYDSMKYQEQQNVRRPKATQGRPPRRRGRRR